MPPKRLEGRHDRGLDELPDAGFTRLGAEPERLGEPALASPHGDGRGRGEASRVPSFQEMRNVPIYQV